MLGLEVRVRESCSTRERRLNAREMKFGLSTRHFRRLKLLQEHLAAVHNMGKFSYDSEVLKGLMCDDDGGAWWPIEGFEIWTVRPGA